MRFDRALEFEIMSAKLFQLARTSKHNYICRLYVLPEYVNMVSKPPGFLL